VTIAENLWLDTPFMTDLSRPDLTLPTPSQHSTDTVFLSYE